uniref:DUF1501 domain-containing protein n=1 Tax=uncultured bacterium BLR2 TaxID=506520 RepID=B5L5U8_9BACT|nr:hypothetical protein AKSOIL_0062 [uncultured bacterium BLR2]
MFTRVHASLTPGVTMDHTRRELLRKAVVTALAASAPGILASRVTLAAPAAGDARFVFVLLRGALDGLGAVPAVGDASYQALRGELAMRDTSGLVALDDLFGLHPALSFMAEQWRARHLTVLHAVATPYRERSHFDAQDVLESGFSVPHASRSGWLNRSLTAMSATAAARLPHNGVALGAGIPLVMRGANDVASWSPSRLPELEEDTLQRLSDLYADDSLLSRRLADALAANDMAGDMPGAVGGRGAAAQVVQTATTAAGFLKREDGPRVAVFETTGWDTHANQGADKGALSLRLATLDAGLRALRNELGPVWDRTVVLVATEFGRTVALNGTRGTDHGTGAAAFLLGGAVSGGKVVADWPGLAPNALFEGRDLRPTTDLRSVMKSLLRDHLGLPRQFIDTAVFPDSAATPYLANLV